MEKLLEEILEAAHQELKMHLLRLGSSRKRSCARRIRLMKQILSDTLQRVNHMLEGDRRYRYFMLLTVRNSLMFTEPKVFGPEHAEPLRQILAMVFSPENKWDKIEDLLTAAGLETVPKQKESSRGD